jgi:hypothetical protein
VDVLSIVRPGSGELAIRTIAWVLRRLAYAEIVAGEGQTA